MIETPVDFSGDFAEANPDTCPRIPVSVVIPVLNEAARLERLLPTLTWADEVIVVDGGSDDDSVSIARVAGARVISVIGRTIGAQRNAAIKAAHHRWILALDADEMVTPELRDELATLVCNPRPTATAYRVRSRNWYLGRELRYGPWGRDWKVRVFTGTHRFSAMRVHENLVSVDTVGTLTGALLHRPYRDLPHHLAKSLTYTRWAAADLRDRGRRATPWDILGRPAWRFVRDYVVMSGWRDGVPGFITSVVSSFYVFLKYSTLLTEQVATGTPATPK
jgi:glycosyltransferase involved in cell wall biosynthesis